MMKEKFIGLYLDRKLIEDFDEDEEIWYDEDKIDDEIDEEMEIEED